MVVLSAPWIRNLHFYMTRAHKLSLHIKDGHGFETWRGSEVHPKLCGITPVATKVHVLLRNFVVVTWMRDTIELV